MKDQKYLLVEDECALDAGWWFEKQLKEKFNLGVNDFREKGENISRADDEIRLKYGGYVLESFAESPYWHLRKTKPNEL